MLLQLRKYDIRLDLVERESLHKTGVAASERMKLLSWIA